MSQQLEPRLFLLVILIAYQGRTNMLSIVGFGVALAIGMSGAAFAQTAAPAAQDFDKPALLNTNSLAVKKSSTRSSQLISSISKKDPRETEEFHFGMSCRGRANGR